MITCQYKFKNETEFKTCLAELNYVGEDKSKQKTGHLKIYTQERLEKHPVSVIVLKKSVSNLTPYRMIRLRKEHIYYYFAIRRKN